MRSGARELGADPKVIGSTVQLDGQPFEVDRRHAARVRLPQRGAAGLPAALRARRRMTCRTCAASAGSTSSHGLPPAPPSTSAQARSARCMERLARDYPESNEGWNRPAIVPLHRVPERRSSSSAAGAARRGRAGAAHRLRQHRAPRCSRAGSPAPAKWPSAPPSARPRGRLLGQLLLESSVLALASAAAGLLLAWAACPLLAALAAQAVPRAAEISHRSRHRRLLAPRRRRRLPRGRHPAGHAHRPASGAGTIAARGPRPVAAAPVASPMRWSPPRAASRCCCSAAPRSRSPVSGGSRTSIPAFAPRTSSPCGCCCRAAAMRRTSTWRSGSAPNCSTRLARFPASSPPAAASAPR